MKPYGRTTDDYGDTGCCPGHDEPVVRKWCGGINKSRAAAKKFRKNVKIQNRTRRRRDKQNLEG